VSRKDPLALASSITFESRIQSPLISIPCSIFAFQLQREQASSALFACLSHEPSTQRVGLTAGTIVSVVPLALASDYHTQFSSCQLAKTFFLKIAVVGAFSLLPADGCSVAHT
jgi:hypothetical protein